MTNQPQPFQPRLPVSRRHLFGIGAGAAAAFGLAACGVSSGSSTGSAGEAASVRRDAHHGHSGTP